MTTFGRWFVPSLEATWVYKPPHSVLKAPGRPRFPSVTSLLTSLIRLWQDGFVPSSLNSISDSPSAEEAQSPRTTCACWLKAFDLLSGTGLYGSAHPTP